MSNYIMFIECLEFCQTIETALRLRASSRPIISRLRPTRSRRAAALRKSREIFVEWVEGEGEGGVGIGVFAISNCRIVGVLP